MSRQPSSHVRQPAVAGSFYPADPEALAILVDGLLADARTGLSAEDHPRMVIVPHAGYNYSGRVAAAGFGRQGAARRVILLGVSHHYLFEGAAISDCSFWQTPLGKVEIDRDTVASLRRTSSAFQLNNRVHEPEHGLEVQVPFLQRALVDFQIVPILLSPESAQDVERVSRELAQFIDDLTLLIVSSDLSHFPRQADAERVDGSTINAILSGISERFQEVITAQLAAGVSALYTCACGAEAIKVGLNIIRLRNLNAIRLLAYANSGQVSGDSSRVVGYAAIGGYRSGGD